MRIEESGRNAQASDVNNFRIGGIYRRGNFNYSVSLKQYVTYKWFRGGSIIDFTAFYEGLGVFIQQIYSFFG